MLTAERRLDMGRQRCRPDSVGEGYFSPSAQNVMTHCRADRASLIASQISVRHEKRFDLTFFYLLLVFMTAVPLMLRGNTNERFLERHRDTVAFGADALGKLVSSCRVRCCD